MKPIVNEETGELRIEHDGDVIYGPTADYQWPINKDPDAMDVILSEGNIDQPQREMWMLVFGAVERNYENEQS